jgi:hypothetical protein
VVNRPPSSSSPPSTATCRTAASHTPPPERPAWAARILYALQSAYLFSREDRLTSGERDLLSAVEMRLRHRLGETAADGSDLAELAAFVLERGTEAIKSEQRKSS